MKKCLWSISMVCIALGALLSLSGCSDTNNERQRLVCEVAIVNSGSPVISAYLDVGADPADPTDDVYPIDFASVTFHARPYNSLITLPVDGPYSYFHITSYDLEWVPSDLAGDSGPLLEQYGNITNGFCDLMVPVNGDASVSILVADRGMKDMPWFMEMASTPVLRESFYANALLTFYGHESGSTEQVTIRAGFVASFIGRLASD